MGIKPVRLKLKSGPKPKQRLFQGRSAGDENGALILSLPGLFCEPGAHMQGNGREFTIGTEPVTQAKTVHIKKPELVGSIPKTRGKSKLKVILNRVITPIGQIKVQFIAKVCVHQIPVKIYRSASQLCIAEWLQKFHTNRCNSQVVRSTLIRAETREIKTIKQGPFIFAF
jgi:hypothetical protein